MKQPFVNATLNDRRKGRELSSHTAQTHPLRPTPIVNSESPVLKKTAPVIMPPQPKKEETPDIEKMKMEILAAMRAVEKKPRAVPKNKLINMASQAIAEEPTKDYADVLAMLLAKK